MMTVCHQRVSGLVRHQPGEAPAEHKDRPDRQRAPGGEENNAEPANGMAAEGPAE